MNSFELSSVPLEKLKMSCRLCLSVDGKLYQLFHSDETEALAVPLSMKVSLCTAVAISKHDKLPQRICENCLNYVNDWYKFRKKCKKINSLLRQKISPRDSNQKIVEGTKEIQLDAKTNEDVAFSDMDVDVEDSAKKDEVEGADPSPVERRRKYKCSVCPDSFYHPKDLKLHRGIIHNYVKPPEKVSTIPDNDVTLEGINMRTRYEMKCCDKIFFSKVQFRRHYNEKHPGEKPFMCETCGKKDFISEETLKRHKILHSGKFRCDICSKTFTCNAILILHKRDKHENDKPFVCDVCGKRFVTELLMNYHKRFHTGEKKYVCEECGLAVVTSSTLAKHKRIHSKEKPHVCHVCGKGFIIKGRLVEHLRVHTGERPYVCQICQKGFTMKDKLKRHLRVHSGEKLFSCEYCGNNYSTRYGLSVHLKSHLTKC